MIIFCFSTQMVSTSTVISTPIPTLATDQASCSSNVDAQVKTKRGRPFGSKNKNPKKKIPASDEQSAKIKKTGKNKIIIKTSSTSSPVLNSVGENQIQSTTSSIANQSDDHSVSVPNELLSKFDVPMPYSDGSPYLQSISDSDRVAKVTPTTPTTVSTDNHPPPPLVSSTPNVVHANQLSNSRSPSPSFEQPTSNSPSDAGLPISPSAELNSPDVDCDADTEDHTTSFALGLYY